MGGVIHVLLTTTIVAIQLSTELVTALCSAGDPPKAEKKS